MPIIYHTISEHQLDICEFDIALKNISSNGLCVWIDLIDADSSELNFIFDRLKINENLMSFCTEASNFPGFYPMKPVSLVVMPVQNEIQDSNDISYLSFLICDQFVVTIRKSTMARFNKSITKLDSIQFLADASPAGLISSFIFGLSLDSLRKAAKLGDLISNMEKRADKDPHSVNLEEITDRRTEVMALESIVQGQLPIVTIFTSSDGVSTFSIVTQSYQRWAIANFHSAEKNLQWLEHRIEIVRSLLDMHAQDTMNKQLGRLTVLSMIFMPITFLAGIWGMNFTYIPLLSQEYGYIWAIIIMLIIALCMFLYFKSKGWFE